MGTYYILILLISLASMWVSNTLKRKFKFYSQKQLRNGMSGKEIAEQMLSDHGIRDVEVVSVRGALTDHYNPQKKTVNLSESVYHERNAAAAAVAAHECGHAIQHAQGYEWLQIRSTLVPMVSVASNLSMLVIIGGLVLMQLVPYGFTIAAIGVGLFGLGTLFSFITLPVEYDASNRALAWLQRKNMVSREELAGAEDAVLMGVLDVEHVGVELLELGVGHPVRVQLEPVAQDDLQLFHAHQDRVLERHADEPAHVNHGQQTLEIVVVVIDYGVLGLQRVQKLFAPDGAFSRQDCLV